MGAMSQLSKRRRLAAAGRKERVHRSEEEPVVAWEEIERNETRAPLPNQSNQRWQAVCIATLLAILVFAVFGQTVGYGFVNFDDNKYVYENPVVLKGFTVAGLRWAITAGEIGHWHPLTWATHMLDCQLYGTWAGGHHLTNTLLHATAAVLLFLVLLQMTGAVWRCAFIAAIWAVHPLRAESVAWVSERKDVLSAVFFMVTIGAYVRYTRRPGVSRYIATVISFALGLLSKNMLVTTPFILLMLDVWPLRRLDEMSKLWTRLKEKIPFIILSAASCLITFLVPEKVAQADQLPAWLRIENSIVSAGVYLRQTIWPLDLAPFYPNPTHSFFLWEVMGLLALLCLVSVRAICVRKRQPWFFVGWFWFVGMLVPVIGLVQISTYSHADRYTYLPQIGLLLAGTWLAAEWAGERGKRRAALSGIGLIILCALVVAARHQVATWHDSETLWTHTLECMPDNALAHYNLGDAMLASGGTDDAIAQFKETLEINPAYVGAHNNFGTALVRQGRTVEAMAQFREAIKINPGDVQAHNCLGTALAHLGRPDEAIDEYRKALEIDPINVGVHNNLGTVLSQLGRPNEAIAQYRAALQIDPASAATHYELGNALLHQGHSEEAINEFRTALLANPSDAEAGDELGIALFNSGQAAEAITVAQRALAIQPASVTIENNLAWMLATAPQPFLRDGARAVQLGMRASQSSGGANPAFLHTLAAAYAAAGNFPAAVIAAQQALKIAAAQSNDPLASRLRGEIKLYQAGQPLGGGD
jgi:tetratricopeptide (TPR) repeat protein